ncbi:MAG: FAD-dependent monooxygenase [Verrucomicrobiota bacterium]
MDTGEFNVAVVGGSLGGLFSAIALDRAGFSTSVYEKSSASMGSRGGGIVVQHDLETFFRRYSPDDPYLPQTSCSTRRFFLPDGNIMADRGPAQSFTSWDALFRKLKACFPNELYHAGREVVHFGAAAESGTLHFKDESQVEVDLVVCSDGSDSKAREQLQPEAYRAYAGYVAWRGFVDEGALPGEVLEALDDRFSFLRLPDGHLLCYPIPGQNGETKVGQRRFNWVWYVDVPDGEALQEMLTDKEGNLRRAAIPPGRTAPPVIEGLRVKADENLPDLLKTLVLSSPDPFLQAIFDATVPSGVVGRACLLGDAGFVVRPHTAAATAKAAAEAMELADLLAANHPESTAALAEFDSFQQRLGAQLYRHGVSLGQH